MWSPLLRRVAGVVSAAALVLSSTSYAGAAADDTDGLPEPRLSNLELTNPVIHAIGAEHTGVPKKTKLKLTLDMAATVRVRVKDVDPYGLSRVFSTELPAGPSVVPMIARIDGTKMPPGKYRVLVKAHSSSGSSEKLVLRLRIIGENG
jgi:hypothetical protein